MTNTEHRIEELEHNLKLDAQRITALENATLPVDPRAPAAQVHQDRWYATFNAFVSGIMTQATHATDSEIAYSAAVKFADRVHGPLEIVVPSSTKFDEAVLAQGGEFIQK